MTSTQVTLREFSQLLIKYVGKPLSDNTFNAQHTSVCRIICALELSYPLLPSPEGNSDVCRLKSVCAALIDSINRLVDDKTGLVYEYGHLIASSRILVPYLRRHLTHRSTGTIHYGLLGIILEWCALPSIHYPSSVRSRTHRLS